MDSVTRAEKRVKRAARIVRRYRAAFDKIRAKLNDLIEIVDEPTTSADLASHLDGIVRMIENVADLDPSEQD